MPENEKEINPTAAQPAAPETQPAAAAQPAPSTPEKDLPDEAAAAQPAAPEREHRLGEGEG